MTIITLTTDFGTGDYEVGVLKGVIWNIAPTVNIVDMSHEIAPQDVLEAALLLWRSSAYFPDHTIHVAVVDPGVGTSRRGIAAQLGSQYFIGPDNGLFTLLIDRATTADWAMQFIHLNRGEFWLPDVSPVFHGRDVFAPVAAHLAMGVPLTSLGMTISDPIRLDIPKPMRTSRGWRGQVIHIDHFGNMTTNLNDIHVRQAKEVTIHIKGKEIAGLVSAFGDRPIGSLVALLDSSGSLAISVVNGNAALNLEASVGDELEVIFR